MTVEGARPRTPRLTGRDRAADEGATAAAGLADELAAEVAGPAGHEQRQAFRACSMSASRSAVSSEPAESRMKPSGTASPPQRARRSAHVWTLPKLVASVTSLAAARKRSARSALPRSNETTDAVAAHLAPRDVVARVVRQAGGARPPRRRARRSVARSPGRCRSRARRAARAWEASGARARSRTDPGARPPAGASRGAPARARGRARSRSRAAGRRGRSSPSSRL